MTAEETVLSSIGKVCELLQVTPGVISRAAAKAGVVATLKLNSVSYYSDSQIEQLRELVPTFRATLSAKERT